MDGLTLTTSTTTDNTLDAALPVNSLTSQYVTFPTMPLDEATYDVFKVLAVYEGTEITIHGPTTETILLKKCGDFEEIILPRSTFYLLESTLPFYALKIAADNNGACMTSLMPSIRWRTSYYFEVTEIPETVYIIVETQSISDIFVNGYAWNTSGGPVVHCHPVEGTTLSGCYYIPPEGDNNINGQGAQLAAYAQGFRDPDTSYSFSSVTAYSYSYCHALGLKVGWTLSDAPLAAAFDADAYIQSSECLPPSIQNTSSEATPITDFWTETQNDTTTTSSCQCPTQESSQSVYLTQETPTSQPCYYPTQDTPSSQPLNLTHDMMTSPPTNPLTQALSTSLTVSPTQDTSTSQPLDLSQTTTTTAQATPFALSFNLSEEEKAELVRQIEDELTVDHRETSSFRRSKESAKDERVSSQTIGSLGVVAIVCFGFVLSFSDLLNLFRHLTTNKGQSDSIEIE